jgi:hypothetical protein
MHALAQMAILEPSGGSTLEMGRVSLRTRVVEWIWRRRRNGLGWIVRRTEGVGGASRQRAAGDQETEEFLHRFEDVFYPPKIMK